MFRKIFIVFVLSVSFFSCKEKTTKKTALTVLHAVPFNTKFIIQVNDKNAFIKNSKQHVMSLLFNKKIAQKIQESLAANAILNDSEKLMIASASEGEAVLIINKNTQQKRDTVKLAISTEREYNGITIKKINQLEKPYYFAQYKALLLGSFSNILIENTIRQLDEKISIFSDSTFTKSYKSIDTNAFANLLINNNKSDLVQLNPFSFDQTTYSNSAFTDWTALDISKTVNQLLLNGISLAKDNEKYLKAFQELQSGKHTIINTIPSNCSLYKSITLTDFKTFKKRLNLVSGKSNTKFTDSILPILKEAAVFEFNKQQLLALKTSNTDKLKTILLAKTNIEQEKSYHETAINTIADKGIFKSFLHPFIQENQVDYYFEKSHIFYFSNSEKALKALINNLENNTLLVQNETIKNAISTSNDGGLLLIYKSNKKPYSLTANNYNYDEQIAYSNIVIQTNITVKNTIEQENIALEKPLENKPQFFYNFRKKEKQLVLSDKNHITLLDQHGKVLWQKEINGEILGEVKEIDIYKNKKKQLLFTTKNTLYCLDINGNNVDEFPITIKGITQGVALFDYDNTKNYRIAVCTGKTLQLYDVNGKKLNGFNYKGTSKIASIPQHFRSFDKDYIVFKTNDGKVNILNRRGEIRTPVNEKFKFSKNPLYFSDRFITFTDKKGSKIQINIASGKVSKQVLNLSKKHFHYSDKKHFITFDKNILKINAKTINLPLGTYQDPVIINTKKQVFIVLLNKEEHKIYTYTSTGKKLANFPVFGNRFITGTAAKNKVVLLSQEDDKHLIKYNF